VVYIEALACGLPIIATDCGGPSDIITKENGILVPCENVDALKEAIRYMIANLSTYNNQAIADKCQARFSPEVIAQQLTTIFEETRNKHKSNS
jgi:glycosyltransferase involved in cell wall biosynthesis